MTFPPFPNLWASLPKKPNQKIRPVDSLSGLHHRAVNEAAMVEDHLDRTRKRILNQLKEVQH